ncbi:MAG: HEAT repeat domain-containing protein [Deltaproteobacteria bacterium]|nr:HEAT repeat domain-containing protein [Deltaproteobacteria bacterium]
MEIDLNAAVECKERLCGTVTHIIINPVTQTVAYLAVTENKEPHHEVLASTGMIASITPGRIQLQCAEDELSGLPRFMEQEFVKMDMPDGRMTGYLMLPYVLPENLLIPILHKRMPADELAVRRGGRVQATDGEAGRVDEFLIDPANGLVSHLVMRQGDGIGQKEISIPLDAIERMDEQSVSLNLAASGLKRLPHIPIWRSFMSNWYGAYDLVRASVASSANTIEEIVQLIADLSSRRDLRRLQARRMLVAIGRPAIPSLNGLLDNRRHQVRWEAAKSLAQIQDPDCIPGLLTAMEDERFDIRWVAAEGMAALGLPALKHLLKLLKGNPDSVRLRESAHHVIRSVIGDAPGHELLPVLLELEKFGTAAASLPRVAQAALASLRTPADYENDTLYEQKTKKRLCQGRP